MCQKLFCIFTCIFTLVFSPSDHYLSSVTWVTDERIAVQWLTRRQDQVLLQIYDYDGTNWNENTVGYISYKALSSEKELFKET